MGQNSTDVCTAASPRIKLLSIALGLGLLALYVTHIALAQEFFVDVPFMDSWENLRPGALRPELDVAWFFKNHNEHIIVPTRIQTWLLYHLDGWNIETNLWVNFFLWGLLVLLIFLVLRRFAGRLPVWLVLLFMAFQLSAISWENHGWSFQSQFHWCLIFLMTSLFFLFDQKQRAFSLVLGCASLVLCLFSFSSGVAASFGVALGFLGFRVLRIGSLEASARRREWVQTAVVLVVYLLSVVFWASLHGNIESAPGLLILPHRDLFWKFFFGLVSIGYGFNDTSWPYTQLASVHRHVYLLVDLVLFALVFVPGFILLRRFRKLGAQEFAVLSGQLAILGMLAAITIGRAQLYWRGQSSRYSEMAILLVPFAMLAWQHALALRPRLRAASYLLLATICLLGFHDDWDYASPYRNWTAHRAKALSKIEDYYEKGSSSLILDIYPWELKQMLDRARELELSFYKKLILEKR